ncbi:hypothetical protein DSM104299_02263 [Baekduia alba]|uniref:hypothetical protein n=1 Tax=Baekduia alba TaxID=2997333 RepID=UPI002340D336|nr:hypothetical protein [Baekduia alba]WCB93550.1 hypothetical protein DSM104299_02263 [Baekduia alba]
MILRPSEAAATCAECGAPLAGDQRYCLECGARHGVPRVDPLQALGFAAASAAPAVAAQPPSPANPARRAPSPRIAAALAATTLVLGGVAGAALGPGPTPSLAATPQRLVALVVPSAPVATTPTEHADEPPAVDSDDAPTPSVDDGASVESAGDDTTTSSSSAAEHGTDDTTTDDTSDSDDPAPASSTTPAATTTSPAATAPAHVWLVALTQADASVYAPGGPFADLAAQGTLLSKYIAAAPSAAANEIALLGGQVPTADCDADLAACVLPAGETSLPDQLASVNLTWKAYVEDPALRCAATPSARVATSLFTTLRQRTDCAQTTVGLDALDADLADATRTPAFSLLVTTNAAAEVPALVAKLQASDAYKKDGVVVVASDAHPPTGDPAAPLGALVLSPRATAGQTVDAATGPVALLRSFDTLLGLDPLATAAQAPAGALDAVLASSGGTPTTSTPSTTSTTTTRRSP